MLDQRHDAAGHEPGGSHWFARARHFDNFDNGPSRGDFDPTTGPAGDYLVGPRAVIRSHNDFDAITFHGTSVLGPCLYQTPVLPLSG